MLKVYSADWCPHCRHTISWLEKEGIPFETIMIETAPEAEVAMVVKANGGDDWVIPTLEYKGRWREGKVFDADELRMDLVTLGVLSG